MEKTQKKLIGMQACSGGLEWAKGKTIEEIWQTCQRGDWLLWLAGKLEIDHKRIVLAACDCAELSLQFVNKGDKRPKKAIETARAWVRGEATIEEVRMAADAAYDAHDAHYAAYAAADAAAYAAADAAYAAAHAAYAAADAAAYAAYAAKRQEWLNKCADITRKHFNLEEIKDAFNEDK